MPTYDVIVGNIGTVYSGTNHRDARLHARTYIDQSKSERGRAGGESVTIFKNGEITEEYIGTHDKEEK